MKKWNYISPEKVNIRQMIDDTVDDYDEIDQSIKERTLRAYAAYDCFDYAGNGNYFAYPDCDAAETM